MCEKYLLERTKHKYSNALNAQTRLTDEGGLFQ